MLLVNIVNAQVIPPPSALHYSAAGGCTSMTFRSGSEFYSTSTSNCDITKPSGTSSGDLLVAIINFNTNGTITAPSGWTLVNSYNPSTGATAEIFFKVAGGSEPTSYNWAFSSSQRVGGVIACFQGSFASDPREGLYTENEASTSTDVTGTSGTVSNDCTMVVYLSAYDQTAGGIWSPDTGWSTAGVNDGSVNAYIGYKEFDSGTTGTVNYTISTMPAGQPYTYLLGFIRND